MKGYDQRVTKPDNWLTDWNGTFVKVIHLPIGESWLECTNEEKIAWEEEHKPQEQEDVEPVNEE